MFGRNSYKPKSNTKKAKSIIRSEMLSGYHVDEYTYGKQKPKTRLDCMKLDADSYNGGHPRGHRVSDYHKGCGLVDAGSFACYYHQTEPMLNKIYGKKQVKKMSDERKWQTYRHLIGREYDSMIRERQRKSYKR